MNTPNSVLPQHIKEAWEKFTEGKSGTLNDAFLFTAGYMAASNSNKEWKTLNDMQWMNIVNHDHAYQNISKDDAVHAAVKATEIKLKEINGYI